MAADPLQLIARIEGVMREYEDDDKPQLQKMIEDISHTGALEVLADHFAIKDFITLLAGRIVEINKLLGEKRRMDELERENLLDRKGLYQEFIDMFDIEKKLSSMEKIVDTL